ncbi:MAG: hypothetical protein HZA89_11400 [Verrucomicrobia bacterium]|nr:hypothetical protein [Verrucomicrobiota bacterium]
MNTVQLMAANHAIHKVANRAPGGIGYDFSKVAAPLPKFAAAARPVSLAPQAKPAGGLDLFRMKSRPAVAEPAHAAASTAPAAAGQTLIGAPVRLRSGARLVQPELRLDAVKVKRNDLSETDFEIIAPRPAPEAASGGAARVEPTGMAWAGWFARMAGAVRAWI